MNQLPGVPALLNSDLRDARQRTAILIERGGVTDHEDFGVAGHRQVSINPNAPGPIGWHAPPFARPPGRAARGPDYRVTENPLAVYDDPFCIDPIYRVPEPYFDSEGLQPFRGRHGE